MATRRRINPEAADPNDLTGVPALSHDPGGIVADIIARSMAVRNQMLQHQTAVRSPGSDGFVFAPVMVNANVNGVPVEVVTPESVELTSQDILDQFRDGFDSRVNDLHSNIEHGTAEDHGEYLRMCSLNANFSLKTDGLLRFPNLCQDEYHSDGVLMNDFATASDNTCRSSVLKAMLDSLDSTAENAPWFEDRNRMLALAARLNGNEALAQGVVSDFRSRTGRNLVLTPVTLDDFDIVTQSLLALGGHEEAFTVYERAVRFVLLNHPHDTVVLEYYLGRMVALGCLSQKLNRTEAERIDLVERYEQVTGNQLNLADFNF